MGKKLTKKLLGISYTHVHDHRHECIGISRNWIDGKYQSDKRCGKSGGRNASRYGLSMKMITETV